MRPVQMMAPWRMDSAHLPQGVAIGMVRKDAPPRASFGRIDVNERDPLVGVRAADLGKAELLA
jgi:hypothetical protein